MNGIVIRKHSADNSNIYTHSCLITFSLLLAFWSILLPGNCFAEERDTVISAESLEYFFQEKKYVARGSVTVERDGMRLHADEVTYFETTSEITAAGNVSADDSELSLKARRAELNMDAGTGKLYQAEILYKEDNYHLKGEEIEKRGDRYYSPEASLTTCDAVVPAWCLKGKKVDLVLGDRLTAHDVSLRIKNIPVLYSPYIWAPIINERQTGFLMPVIGYSESRGIHLNLPFFWAIAENRDATFMLDTYSERGIGGGIEYRFKKPGGIESNWWAYYINDTEVDKNYFELQVRHEQRSSERLGGYLSVNYVNEKDFFREYSNYLDVRTQRFLESTGEVTLPLRQSRMYLLSQYWVDLKEDTGDVPQRLPEAGYVLNYSRLGKFLFFASVNAVNLWREEGLSAGRLDIYPQLLHTMGTDFVVSQRAGLRGTAYTYYANDDHDDDSARRLLLEYEILGHTRLANRYASFTHVVEPLIGYHFISSSEDDLPVFDATELFRKTSRINLGLLNRLFVQGEEWGTLRVTQSIDLDDGHEAFDPLLLEFGMSRPFPLKINTLYNTDKGRIEAVTSELGFRLSEAFFSVGQRYNREKDVRLYKSYVAYRPVPSLQLAGGIWYDADEGEVSDILLSMTYLRQCWGFRIEYTKHPDDYSLTAQFELTGLFSNISDR